MTLVLSVSCPAYALHVSDRLVSKGGKPHDPLANKTVVFRATDGLLVFGYTGSRARTWAVTARSGWAGSRFVTWGRA